MDAPLWFFYAVQKLLQYTSDYTFVKDCLYPTMKEIVEHYRLGTHFQIRMAGGPGLQLTWMDAYCSI